MLGEDVAYIPLEITIFYFLHGSKVTGYMNTPRPAATRTSVRSVSRSNRTLTGNTLSRAAATAVARHPGVGLVEGPAPHRTSEHRSPSSRPDADQIRLLEVVIRVRLHRPAAVAGVILLIVMSMVTFVLFFASPVDPAHFACGKNCSPAAASRPRKALGYDKPSSCSGPTSPRASSSGRDYPDDPELREDSARARRALPGPLPGLLPVNSTHGQRRLIKDALPVSLLARDRRLHLLDHRRRALRRHRRAATRARSSTAASSASALVFYAFPTFFIGLFLYKFVAIKWELVPDPGVHRDRRRRRRRAGSAACSCPALTLALFFMAGYVRMTRAFVLESMSEDYVRTARAKGLAAARVLLKHSLRAALTPLVTMVGLDFAGLMGGAIITETVFNYHGLGKLAVDANITPSTCPTIIGLVLLLAAFVIVANIIVDVLYAVIDPRVRVG